MRQDEAIEYKQYHKNVVNLGGSIASAFKKTLLKNSIVIVEDIIVLKKKDEDSLRNWLNYTAHHDSLKIFCTAHTVYKTSLTSSLPSLNYLLFACQTMSSEALIKHVCLMLNLGPDKSQSWCTIFKKSPREYGYFLVLDNAKQDLHLLEPSGNLKLVLKYNGNDPSDENSTSDSYDPVQLEKQFAGYFETHPEKAAACALFSIIIKVIPKNMLRPLDLSVTFRRAARAVSSDARVHASSSSGSSSSSNTPPCRSANEREKYAEPPKKQISLIDYIDTLLDPHPITRAHLDFKVLHNYISSLCNIPIYFIKNYEFRYRPASPQFPRDSSSSSSSSWPSERNTTNLSGSSTSGLTKNGPTQRGKSGLRTVQPTSRPTESAPESAQTSSATE